MSEPLRLALRVHRREFGWQEDLKQLEVLATATPLPDWWLEAGSTERDRFLADFLELYIHDPVFTSAIDALLARAR